MPRSARCLGYARVSSEDQARGSSLRDQRAVIDAYAAAQGGLTLERIYVEAESAIYEKQERREQMQALLRDVRSGDLVLCDKLDRWSRDPEFTYRTLREIREAGAKVYFIGEALDPSTPEGDSMLGMRVLMAREEHKRIRLRTVGTRKSQRNRGLYSEGLVPVGYVRRLGKGYKGHDKNALQIDERGAAQIRSAFALAIEGASTREIAEALRQADPGFRAWDHVGVARTLRKRIYLGEVEDAQGTRIPGAHPPIVSPADFARAASALSSRRHGGAKPSPAARTATWILRGVGVCGTCGARISSAYGESGHGYYICGRKCGAKYAPVIEQDAAGERAILAYLVTLRRELAGPVKLRSVPPPVDYSAKRAKLQTKRERFLEAFGEGDIDRAELRAALGKLDAQRDEIARAEAAALPPAAPAQDRSAVLAHIEGIEAAWAGVAGAGRRAILEALALKAEIVRGQDPVITWKDADTLRAR